MADEELVLRASVQDEASAPLDRIDRKVDEVGRSTEDAGRRAGGPGAAGLGRFEAAGRRVHSTFTRLDSTLRTVSRRVGQEMATGLRRGATALGVMGAAAGVFGLKSASNFQASGIAFETMLGSVERGQALFRELQALNLRTPFELKDITGAEQMLLRFNLTGERSVSVLKGMLDVAALSDDPTGNLNAMARAIGQINSSGKLMGQDALQLVQAGINAYDVYAQKLGITQGEARKLGEAGKLSADVLLDAVANLDGPLEKFRGGAEKMSRTLLGQWSNLKDAINVGLAEAASPMVSIMTDQIGTPDKPGPLVGGIMTLINGVGPSLFAFLGTLVGGVSRLLPVVEPVLTAITTGLDRLVTAAGPAMRAMAPLGEDIGDALVELVDALVPVMPDLVYGFVGLVGVLPEFVRLLAALVPIVSPIARLVGAMVRFEPVKGIMAALLTTLLGYRALAGAVGAVRSLAGALGLVATNGAAAQAATGAGGAATFGRFAGLAGKAIPAVAGGALIVSAATDKKPSLSSDLKLVAGAGAIGATAGSIIPGVGTLIGGGLGLGAGGAVAVGRRLLGDLPARHASTLARDSAVEASTPGSRTLTSSHRTFAVLGGGSGHVRGTAVDRHGSYMARYRENVLASGGWAAQHGGHVHADYGDLAAPARSRPRPAGMPAASSAQRQLVVMGNVIGVDDLEARFKQWDRDLDNEDRRRHRKPQP